MWGRFQKNGKSLIVIKRASIHTIPKEIRRLQFPHEKKEIWTDFRLDLEPRIIETVRTEFLTGSVLNLLPPGGYIPPLVSNCQRDETFLTNHWVKRGMMEKNSKYYHKFNNNFGTLSNLIIPSPTISAPVLQNLVFFLGWTFQHDDILDNILDHRNGDFPRGWDTISEANDVFNDILLNKYGINSDKDNFPNLDFPLFKPLCFTWRDMHSNLHETIPHYEARNGTFLRYMKHYLDSNIMIHGERLNRRFSEESGKYWLRFSTGFKPWMEVVNMVRGYDVPKRMRKDWYFIRLRVASEDVVGFINDVFGVAKDLNNQETDTFVMFKHLEKGIPFLEAYQQTLDFLNEQIRDVMRLLVILRERYPDDPDAEGFLKATEEFIDGYLRWCISCPRYGGKTSWKEREEVYKYD